MADDKLKVRKRTGGDAAHAVVKAGLSAVPVVGGTAVELFQYVVQLPLEKRREKWMSDVGEKLHELESNELKLEVRDQGCDCVVVPRFGLDVALFLGNKGHTYSRFLEAKVYAAGRPGGVGFGTQAGQGPQVELLLCSEKDLTLLDTSVRWILADATRQPGTKRYALFDCRRAKAAAMGEVRKGKQNNLKISGIQECFVTWTELVAQLREFLFEPVRTA